MKILLGETRSRRNVEMLKERGWGRIFVTGKPCPFPFEPWAFDNGAFVAWTKGEGFPTEAFERRLAVAYQTPMDPYLAVCPDIVAGGCESLQFSLSWLPRLPRWPWYLAVQDGMELSEVEDSLHLFSGLFLGGSDKFKATAYRWCKLAHKHQKKFHYGRASTPRKLQAAYRCGADSCDTSFPLWTQDRMRIFGHMATNLGNQQEIYFAEEQCQTA